MLQRHEETPPQEELPPAAQTRVTAQELADAVAALEARKEETARREHNTIAIGEAVQQLELEATPDEILAEVRALRARQGAGATVPSKVRQRRVVPGLVGSAAVLFLLAGLTGVRSIRSGAPVQVASPHTQPAGPVIRTIGEIGNGAPFFCDGKTLNAIMDRVGGNRPAALAETLVETGTKRENYWALVKHDGALYLRGWTAPMSEQALRVGSVELYNEPGSDGLPGSHGLHGYEPTPLTLRVGDFQIDREGYLSRTVRVLRLDEHAREFWETPPTAVR